MFPDGFKNETQVICTVLAHDQENDPDIAAMVGASAALTLSGIPFLGPIGGARVGYKDGAYILNPTHAQMADTELDLVMAGTHDAVMMVESEAKELSEEIMLGAVLFGQQGFQPVIEMIIAMAEECAKEPWELEIEDHGELYGEIKAALEADLRSAYAEPLKQARQELIGAAKAKAVEQFVSDDGADEPLVMAQFKKLEKDIVRNGILDTKKRIDGRDTETVRPIVVRGRRFAACSRQCALHPRRDPGPGGGNPRHRPGRADHRQPGR